LFREKWQSCHDSFFCDSFGPVFYDRNLKTEVNRSNEYDSFSELLDRHKHTLQIAIMPESKVGNFTTSKNQCVEDRFIEARYNVALEWPL
jgi:hypothetical protein